MAPAVPSPRDPFTDVLLGYRPRSAWDNLTPEQRELVGPNPFPDPLGSGFRESMGLPEWRSQPIDYITPSQKETALKMLGRGALTSLGTVGGYLDKYTGSRALRGGVGALMNHLDPQGGHKGSLRELMSIIPGSDWLGLTDPADSPSGMEVAGIKNDPNSWWDNIAGFGVEMALDPTLFVGGFLKGGLSAGGKALQAAGGLRDVDWALKAAARAAGGDVGRLAARKATSLGDALKALPDKQLATSLMDDLTKRAGNPSVLDDWLTSPIGKSLDVGVPFSERMRTGFNVPGVDRMRDWAFDKLQGSLPGRLIQNQLYAPAKGMKTQLGQDVAKQVSYIQGKTPEFVEKIITEAADLKAAGKWTPADKIRLYQELEGFASTQNPSAIQEIQDYINTVVRKERADLGMGDELRDMEIALDKYAPRTGVLSEANLQAERSGRLYMPVLDSKGYDLTRSLALKHIRGGTGAIMEMMMDPGLQAIKDGKGWRTRVVDYLTNNYGAKGKNILPEHEKIPELMDELVEVIHKTPLDVMQKGFYEHPLESMYSYLRRHTDKVAISRAQIELMAHGAAAAKSAQAGTEMSSFADLFKMRPRDGRWVTSTNMAPHGDIYKDLADVAKMNGKNPLAGGAYIEYIKKYGTDAQRTEMEYLKNAWDAAVQAKDPVAYKTVVEGNAAMKGVKEFLDDFGKNTLVPKEVMDDVLHWDRLFEPGQQITELKNWWDKATNLFKAGVLTWPARYVRDLFSGQVQNILLNQWSPRAASDVLSYLHKGAVANPKRYLTHIPKVKLDAMTDDQALKALNAHLASIGILGEQHAPLAQVGNVTAKRGLEGVLQDMPGQGSSPLSAAFGELSGLKTKAGWNPFGFRGVSGDTTTFVPGRIGDIAGKTTDNANRLVAYLTLKARGMATDEAVRRVMSSQVDYATKTLTQTERQILTRAFPFWRYTSKMFPYVFQEILNRPGGAMAQTIRTTGRAGSGREDFVPEHIRQTAAIPLSGMFGSKDPKRQRYLTGMGFMHEDPLSMFQPGHTPMATAQNVLQDIFGRTNPLIKMPVELAFGKQLYSGRELADMDGTVARIIGNITGKEPPQTDRLMEHALANSPIARGLTSLRTLTDPAKGIGAKALNLLTGARVQDVDMERARQIAISSGIQDLLRGTKGVRTLRPHLYVRKEDRAGMDPIDLMLMDLYSQQLAEAKRDRINASRGKMTVQQILDLARGNAELNLDRGIP